MSLYRHVSGRDELLDLVLARLVSEIPARPSTGDWRAGCRRARPRRARGAPAAPEAHGPADLAGPGSGGGLATLERALSIFRGAGFGPRDAAFANHALGNYVAGAALWEAVGLAGATGEERRARATQPRRRRRRCPADTYPSIAWAAPALFAGTADDRFEFGLGVLLDGLAARLPS